MSTRYFWVMEKADREGGVELPAKYLARGDAGCFRWDGDVHAAIKFADEASANLCAPALVAPSHGNYWTATMPGTG